MFFLLRLLVGIPVAFAIMLAAMAVMTAGDVGLGMIAQRMFASTNSFPLIAVPFSFWPVICWRRVPFLNIW